MALLTDNVDAVEVSATATKAVKPSTKLSSKPVPGKPHSPDQELEVFGKWTSDSIWVPPKDNSAELAKSMLAKFGAFASKSKCWDAIVKEHRSKFTQVRQFELPKPSIRLPQGQLYVTVTEQKDFDTIEDPIPRCVQSRLDEFLAGPGKQRGVKVYYLKPLCIEDDNKLIFTSQDELDQAISQIQYEVFSEYRRRYLGHNLKRVVTGTLNAGLAIPRALVKSEINKKRREIEAYHQHLEFERRKRALDATQAHRDLRTTGCTFDEMLNLMDPPKREDVIEHYVTENEKSGFDRKMFLIASAATLPWFIGLSLAAYNMVAVSMAASLVVCDPAFVAEMPGSNGSVLKIGHFDEVDGVTHVEI